MKMTELNHHFRSLF